MKKLFMLIISLIIIPSVIGINVNESNREYAESRIFNTSDSYIIHWSEDNKEYRSVKSWDLGVRRVYNNTFATLEIDPHYKQIITVLESDEAGQFTTIKIRLEENPNNPYESRTVPFQACVNTTKIFNSRRFEVPNTFCPEEMTQYFIGNINFDTDYIIRFLEHPRPYIWWFGTDDYDGTFGQGGIGDGLDVCLFAFAEISLNQTQTYVGQTFKMGMKWNKDSGLGCPSAYLENQNYNDLSVWRMISGTTPPTNTNLVCSTPTCNKFTPTINVWYYDTVECYSAGNISLRVWITASPSAIPSPTRNMECLPVPVPEDTIIRPEDSFIIEDLILKDKEKKGYWLVLGVLPLVVVLTKKKRKKEN